MGKTVIKDQSMSGFMIILWFIKPVMYSLNPHVVCLYVTNINNDFIIYFEKK